MLPTLLLLLFLGLAALHVFTRYNRRGRLANKIPGATAFPIIGNLLYFNETCPHIIWTKLRNWVAEYYPIMRVWYVRSAVITVCHPDDVEILLASQKAIDKGYVYDHLHPWLKTGLLTSTGAKWRQRRKILTPAFHFNILRKYLSIIVEESERCVKDLKAEGEAPVKSLIPFTSKLTLNVICEAAMDVALDKMECTGIDKYKKAIHDFGYVVVFRIPRPYIFDWMMKPVWKIGRMQRDAIKILHDFTDKVIKERRTYHESTQNKYLKNLEDIDNDVDLGRKKRLSMLDLLLSAEQRGLIDDEGIREEVDTFTFEGHDTTGSALTFALMLLAENKEAQARARVEVTEIYNRNKGEVEMSDLPEFNYLELCIKESLRLYPAVPSIFRYVDEDLQLKHALIPGGTHIMCNIYDLHRDANYWPEPNKFDPDRFLPDRFKGRHPFAYVPFSAGPRNCIGQKFAMMELKLLIARILYDFHLEPVDRHSDIKLVADLVIRPLNPIRIKFVRVNKE